MIKLTGNFTIILLLISNITLANDESWAEKNRVAFIDGCVRGVLDPARRDYYARAESRGNFNPNPFPEQQVKSSIEPLCSCVAEKIRKNNIPFEKAVRNAPEVIEITKEAVTSGECRMGGKLGEMVSRKIHPE